MKKKYAILLCMAFMLCGCTNTEDTPIDEVSTDVYSSQVVEDIGYDDDAAFTFDDSSYVDEQDKSAEYGVNSTSSSDAYQFLNDDGIVNLSSLDDTAKPGVYDYTGRFAYPDVNESTYSKNINMTYRSDMHASYDYSDGEEYQGVINIHLGLDEYEFCFNEDAHVDGIADYEEFGTYKTPDGETTIVMSKDSREGGGYSVYMYKLGPFSISVQRNLNDSLYTEEELQSIIDSIILK